MPWVPRQVRFFIPTAWRSCASAGTPCNHSRMLCIGAPDSIWSCCGFLSDRHHACRHHNLACGSQPGLCVAAASHVLQLRLPFTRPPPRHTAEPNDWAKPDVQVLCKQEPLCEHCRAIKVCAGLRVALT